MSNRRNTSVPKSRACAEPVSARIAAAAKELDTKRQVSQVSGLEGWYPYYAGFTESFASGVISAAAEGRTISVLDPWNGSGTTTRAAASLGHATTGFDINPVTVLVASAKMANADDAAHVLGLAKRLSTTEPLTRSRKTDPLATWLPLAVVSCFRRIEARIRVELATTREGSVLSPASMTLPPLAAFLLLALIRAARQLAAIKKGSNPTWTRPEEEIARSPASALEGLWLRQIEEMAGDLALHGRKGEHLSSSVIQLASSTAMPIEAESIDLVVTSPPYCTRIDYMVGSSFELAALGIGEGDARYRALRELAMGTPLSRGRSVPEANGDWPESVRSLLTAIRSHTSKSSESYYYKTYHQYFSDSWKSLREIQRVLKPRGGAALVVQSSYYKELHVDLPKLFADMANSLGLKGSIGATTKVKRALAQINSKSKNHRSDKAYEESVVVLDRL